MRHNEFNPYFTFTEEDLENINKMSVEGLQVLWHGSAFFRPVVRCSLLKRKGIHDYVQRLNESLELR